MRRFVFPSVLLVVVVVACSGSKESPLFGSSDGGVDGASACAADPGVLQRTVLGPRCALAGCHSGAQPAGDLDLSSASFTQSLVGVPASECGGQVRVVAGDPERSYFYRKLVDDRPPCGAHMPLGQASLSGDQIACVKQWIASLPATSGGADAATDAPAIACEPGLTACGGACVDTQTDRENCGRCGAACPVACSSGGCVTTCPPPTTNCSGSCVDTTASASHCGSCGNACTGGKVCQSSQCSCGASVSFATRIQQQILTPECATAGCHAGVRPQASLNLSAGSAYTQLVNAASSTCSGRVRVKPGAVDQSYLWNKLTGVGMCSGTQMPKSGGALPAADLDAIRAWICNGAPNN
jgi:hypothetical protein